RGLGAGDDAATAAPSIDEIAEIAATVTVTVSLRRGDVEGAVIDVVCHAVAVDVQNRWTVVDHPGASGPAQHGVGETTGGPQRAVPRVDGAQVTPDRRPGRPIEAYRCLTRGCEPGPRWQIGRRDGDVQILGLDDVLFGCTSRRVDASANRPGRAVEVRGHR